MNKPLEIREFDSITGNPDAKDRYDHYLDEPAFGQLVSFALETQGTDEQGDPLNFLSVRRDHFGDVVTAKNYVGLIQTQSGDQIQIMPKIYFGSGTDEENRRDTRSIFLRMLRSLRDFDYKVFGEADLSADRMNLYEFLIRIYAKAAGSLARRGLKSDYVRREDNLTSFKGKLKIKDQIQENLSHRERFYVEFDEYLTDRAENRLIKSTLLKLQSLTESAENKREINRTLAYFELVPESQNVDADLSKVSSARTMKEYEMLISWSRVFLKNKSFTAFSGTISSRALLFPMDKLFESYIAKQARAIFGEAGWDVSAQDSGYFLFDEPDPQFRLRPDIVVTKSDGSRVIMDTKWKSLHDSGRDNYGISQGDMYQMYAYGKKYGVGGIWLLYPLNEEMKSNAPIEFKAVVGEPSEVIVHVFFVDLANVNACIEDLRSKI